MAMIEKHKRVRDFAVGVAAQCRFVVRLLCFLGFTFFMLAGPVHATSDAFNDPSKRGGGGTGAAGTGTDFVPTVPVVDGGAISVGATAQVVVLFRNDSGRPLTTGAIQLYPSSTVSASVSLNQCGQEPLEGGVVCAVSVSVKALQPGNWRIDMLMRHSGRARLVTSTLSGTVTAGDGGGTKFISDIDTIPERLDFGNLKTSQPIVKSVILRNSTSTTIDIKSVYIEAAQQSGYSVRTDCEKMEPGQACVVTVTWSPVLAGQASGVLVVEHSGPTTIASVNLDGKFEPETTAQAETFPRAVPGKGLIVASQDKVDFGSSIETTSAITISLVNIGDAPVTIKEVALAGSDSGVTVQKKGCSPGVVLEPVEACPLTISWSPVREGAIIDDIHVIHDGARGILVLPVRGTAKKIISQDTKAVRMTVSGKGSKSMKGMEDEGGEESISGEEEGGKPSGRPVAKKPKKSPLEDFVIERDDDVDPATALDGFIITSLSPSRAIISGPGGSRIVFNNEDVVLGGFLWSVNIRSSGIEFRTDNDKVLLLFDRSLSSVNRVSGQSGSGKGSGSGTSGSSSSTPSTSSSTASTTK